jgi:hypothetical protein
MAQPKRQAGSTKEPCPAALEEAPSHAAPFPLRVRCRALLAARPLPPGDTDRPAWRAAFHKARDRREVAAYSCLFVAPEEPGGVRLAGWLAPVVEDGAVRWIVSVCRDVTHDEPHPAPAMPTGAGGMPSRPPGVPAGALWLSAIGTRVIAYLAAAGHAKGEAIADAVGQPHAHRFKSLLTDLADRGILDSSAGHGYRCAGAVGA